MIALCNVGSELTAGAANARMRVYCTAGATSSGAQPVHRTSGSAYALDRNKEAVGVQGIEHFVSASEKQSEDISSHLKKPEDP